ncbi:SLBB domain-containing protein [Enterococcus faecium]|nr:SLBB domain-containing protein [Enterococcus faecium]MBK4839428.1 competence protein ComEA [Enterococcus faecium]MDK4349976.1 SLBB domain-containing protein [Enterococcus faecium]MDK4394262.1 SLBB domain-containing protein [Enterococcus faecium]
MNDFYWSFFGKRTMIEKISKKILASPKLIIWMSMLVLIFCIASGFLLSNLLFYREPEETAAKEILSPFSSSGEDPSAEGNDVEEDARPKVMYTDIKGSVKEPGIYSFSSEERVHDVLKRAGGLLEEADSDRINFSAKIEDQQVLYIPAVGEELPEHLDQVGILGRKTAYSRFRASQNKYQYSHSIRTSADSWDRISQSARNHSI